MTRNAEGFAQIGQGRSEATDAVMTAFYVTNNVQVSFMAFALGITFGLGTIFVLVQNGFVLGVTLALVQHYGSAAAFWPSSPRTAPSSCSPSCSPRPPGWAWGTPWWRRAPTPAWWRSSWPRATPPGW